MKTKIFSIVNQKGGVGKTTTAVNLSAVLAVMGHKVLLIDLDSQGNSSSGLGVKQADREVTSYHVLTGIRTIQNSIRNTEIPNLYIVPSNTNLAGLEVEIVNLSNREVILSSVLREIEGEYDYIIVDCPPSLNLLTLNALVASHEVIIPMLCDFYSLEGLSHLLKTIEIIRKKMNPGLNINGILFTMYDKRSRLTEYVEKDVRSCLGKLVYETTIPRNVRLSEAPSHGKAAIIYDHKCTGSMAYMALAKELLEKEESKVEMLVR